MILIPSIDILRGACVRLYRGDYGKISTYDGDPPEIAAAFQKWGATRIHVVDLDAARGGEANNREVIGRIRSAVSCCLEVGGGIRTETDVDELLSIGVDRLITGTVLAKNPDEVQRWISARGNVIVAGIDAREGKVRISGWKESSGIDDSELAVKAAAMGAVSIVYTNIAVDGTLVGPDIENTNRIAEIAGIPVILSGGIGSLEDLDKIAEAGHSGLAGVISGRAIYEGALDAETALARFGGSGSDADTF